MNGGEPPIGKTAGDDTAARAMAGRVSDRSSGATTTRHRQQSDPANRSGIRKPAPTVFTDDKQSVGRQRTFFDDSTPPPTPSYANSLSPSLGYTPSLFRSGGAPVGKGGGDYDYRYDHVAPPAPLPPRPHLICGLRKRVLGIIVGVAAVAIIALAIGLGVGLSTNSDSSSQDSSVDQTADSTSTESSPTTATVDPTATSSATETIDVGDSNVCPYANNTRYDIPGSDKTFLRLCGVDYVSADGAKDLATVWTASVQDCMINCAGFDGCVACSWGVLPDDNYRDNHRCFLKSAIGEPEETRESWDFAILQ